MKERGDIPEAYARAALDRACAAIIDAVNGSQEATLHRECFSIGGLVASGALDPALAVARLDEAAQRMPAYRERWTGLEAKVRASLQRGLGSPRTPPDGRGRASQPKNGPPQPVCGPSQGSTTTADAMRVWRAASDPRRSAAVTAYLTSRKLDLGDDLAGDVLRWHPRFGALCALFRNIETNRPQAVSRIFIESEGRKLGRKFIGPVGVAAIKLDPNENVLGSLHIGEGLETCMAARQFGLKPTWALGSVNAVASFPVLDGVECLTLLKEADDASERACEACAARWHAAGREVFINQPTIGKDLNDAIRLWRAP